MIFSEILFQEILTLKDYFDTYLYLISIQYVYYLVLFLNRKEIWKELSLQSVKQVQRLLVRLYIVYGSRDPFHVFASLQLTTSATRNCVWTSKAVLAFKMRPHKQLPQLM